MRGKNDFIFLKVDSDSRRFYSVASILFALVDPCCIYILLNLYSVHYLKRLTWYCMYYQLQTLLYRRLRHLTINCIIFFVVVVLKFTNNFYHFLCRRFFFFFLMFMYLVFFYSDGIFVCVVCLHMFGCWIPIAQGRSISFLCVKTFKMLNLFLWLLQFVFKWHHMNIFIEK